MSKKQIKLSIPTPCTEDWNTMTATQSGKFCTSCQKTVIDFSRMSDADIIRYFTDFQGDTCGRLSEKQLNSVIAEPLVLKPNYRWAYALSALLLPTIAASQTVKNSEPMEMRDPSVHEAKSVENDLPIEVKIKDIVKDIRGEALIGALIRLKGTEIGTLTDLEGLFQLEFSSKETMHNTFEIEVIYPGFDTASVKINRNQVQEELKIILKEVQLPFTVVGYQRIGKICISRDYEDRKLSIKHRIRNLFRKKKRD